MNTLGKQFEAVRARIIEAAEITAVQAFKVIGEDPFQAVYLYFKPGTLPLIAARDVPGPGYELAINERLPRGYTVESFKNMICEICRHLPIVPIEEGGPADV